MASLNDSVVIIKHFCYKCKEEVEVLSSGQKCGRCKTAFIEEIFETKDSPKESHQKPSQELKESVNELTDKSECTICLQTIDSTQKDVTLGCRHIFHKACIKQWFQLKNNCPLCRTQIDVPAVVTPVRPRQMLIRSHLNRSRSPISPFPQSSRRLTNTPITPNDELLELLRRLELQMETPRRVRNHFRRTVNFNLNEEENHSFTWIFPSESEVFVAEDQSTPNTSN